jgi:hypothetical protein
MKIPRAVKKMGTRLRGVEGCLVLATALALAACGAPPAPSAAGAQTRTATPSPAADPANAAVLAAYRSATRAFVHAGVTMNPNDPLLPATMTGEELSTVKKNLLIDQASHLIAKGDITVTDPHVVSNDHGSAVVRDCQYSAVLLVDATTGQGAPGVANGPQNIAVTATLALTDGTWKVSLEDLKVGTCPLGY